MHLVIDIGNTRVKAALFEQNDLKYFFVFNDMAHFFESEILKKYAVDHCILVTVVDAIDAYLKLLQQHCTVLLYNVTTPTPLKNLYQSVNTLGPDRLAAAVAGNYLFPNADLLVIDAGTCIKYNFVNNKNEFIGGAISPGIKMRFRALNAFTARLPLLQLDGNYDKLIGTTSEENMLSGVELGSLAEVAAFINEYKHLYPDLKVVLTGGDVRFFEKRLKTSIFADEYLILKGLNIILNYNLTLAIQH